MSDRVNQTQTELFNLYTDKEGFLAVQKEIARSLAVIADALAWQVEQAIEDRREVQA